ncbi:MAG: 1-deoxy-D-xylulose-5-phosphate reductoisomerase, partial [Firmicutes bacterium]|nr:1-deoxy-D-xylulose-5-phosphate reductoisomerase [Bacillota bacterium]
MKNVVILGSTGSIGTSVLNIIRRNPDKFKVVGLVSNVNYDLLHAQAKEFSPEFVGLCSEKHAIEAEKKHGKFLTEVGEKASIIASSLKSADTVVCAIVGVAGMQSVYSAVKERKQILLANKESLVSGGEIIMNLAHKNDVEIIPLDSEHSAIWQCLAGGGRERSVINGAIPLSVDKIILTASGGAFFEKSKDELKKVTIKDATTHPNWSMGKKITVDSS